MSLAKQTLGRRGEDLACRELERCGCVVLARRYRRRGGEVDIVARDGQTVVFVEVKTRDGSEFGSGAEAVNGVKRRRIADVALDYLSRHGLSGCPCRFDVMSIEMSGARPRIEWYRSAFDAPDVWAR